MENKLNQFNNYFFTGIAGTGMSAVAQYLKGIGKNVSGSDREFSRKENILIRNQFSRLGISCYPQDGTGITADIDAVIVSTAIEESNTEYQKAIDLKIPIVRRSELLSLISETKRTIAVGGTSGKSTTAAMIFHILQNNGCSPSLITGAGLTSLQEKGLPGNAWIGKSDWLVIEADESDGSIVNYHPEISVLLNIEKDHKELDKLTELFSIFKNNTRGKFIVNNDHPLTRALSQDKKLNFGTKGNAGYIGSHFEQKGFSISFQINSIPFNMPVIGRHNMENALASVSAASAIGISPSISAESLKTFQGIYRRTQLAGEKNGIYVVDDFAHNPSEVAAAIKSCQNIGKRVLAWFQPHGFGPLRFFHKELSQEVLNVLRDNDIFYISDVYYAGGTVDKNITSDIVINPIVKKGKKAYYIPDKADIPEKLKAEVKKGDVILLMGARDPDLSEFAGQIFAAL